MTPMLKLAFLEEMKTMFSEYYQDFYDWVEKGDHTTKAFGDSWNAPYGDCDTIEVGPDGMEVDKKDVPVLMFSVVFSVDKSGKFIMDVDLLGEGSSKNRVCRMAITKFSNGDMSCTDEYMNLHLLLGIHE